MSNRVESLAPGTAPDDSGTTELEQLLSQPGEPRQATGNIGRIDGMLVGTLLAFIDPGIPLVTYPGQPGTAALAARAAVDLQPEQIGHEVTLMFENGDPLRPVVTGRIRTPAVWRSGERPAQVDVDADGQRLVVTAKEQLVLRCGEASITLTKAGKVLVQGTYVSHRSSGVVRIKGGSVQLN